VAWLPWAWVVLALLFIIAEIFTAGFFLICFGVGAAGAALAAFLGVGLEWQVAIFVLISSVAVVLVRPLANRVSNPNTHLVGIDRVLGKEGIVLETIDPVSGHGVVRINSERWSAESTEGRPIVAGSQVLVVAVQGTHLMVRPIQPAPVA
jgi:membrane protein implicated in regulation of membrane protease activity